MKFRKKKPKRVQESGLSLPEEEESSDDDDDDEDEDGRNVACREAHGDLLRLYLYHGDIVIQQGLGLQKYYEASTF